MHALLKDLRVIEGSSFVAAPSCGLHLSQMGAEVIRFDTIGGGPDFNRWPQAGNGASLFWEGLNKGKKSVAIDLRRPEGREIATALITAPGTGAGIFVTNFPAAGFLAHDHLAQHRPDLLTVRIMGHASGQQAVDYTVNNAVGLPYMTGPQSLGDEPVNHVLPAWDLLAGAHAAFSVLAAERLRRETGQGQELRLPLSDLAMATVGNLGMIAEAILSGESRPRCGNALFGAFGRDFMTSDDKRIMIVAITANQWRGLIDALNITAKIAALETALSVSFAHDEGLRFVHRDVLFTIVGTAVKARPLNDLSAIFDAKGVCWSLYRHLHEALRDDDAFSARNPMFTEISHPSGHAYLTPGASTSFTGLERLPPSRAPHLGEHTEWVLAEVMGLPSNEIARLHDAGIVASSRA